MPLISTCEFLSGWVSGVLGIMTGHPLDTVKVRQQISKDKSLTGNLKATYKYEGIRGFYKGMFFPTLSAGVLNALFFGVYGNSLRQMIRGSDRTLCCEDTESEDTYYSSVSWHWRVALAGFLGGAAGVLVGCPVDCIKTKLQGNTKDHLSPWTVSKNIVRQRGVRAIYCGFLPMICRDGPGFATYIVTYEHVLCSIEGKLPLGGQHRIFAEILSGGLAGSISWIAGMPFDVVKSRIQADDPFKPKYNGMVDCFQKSYRTEGLGIFFNGMSTAIIRSFPVNAVTFVVYQFCMNKCLNFNRTK
ncbi:unnamed protein product [Nesidiocoris tenuis]|uniref:Solute carrier family 25 member 45 n=1 Tax=Nesidiocoris tenuis TaxID=355587 RepID=A0A6H5HCP6_9HEMI|nr:unnamed protein product [Nesidiocoris tenuis]